MLGADSYLIYDNEALEEWIMLPYRPNHKLKANLLNMTASTSRSQKNIDSFILRFFPFCYLILAVTNQLFSTFYE